MVRAPPLVPIHIDQTHPEAGLEAGGPMGQVLTDLANAFSLDIDLQTTHTDEPMWPMGRTLALAIVLSAALWILIAGAIYII